MLPPNNFVKRVEDTAGSTVRIVFCIMLTIIPVANEVTINVDAGIIAVECVCTTLIIVLNRRFPDIDLY